MAIQIKNDNVLIGHINELEDKFNDYLPLAGGRLTGPLTSSSSITASGGFIGDLTGNASTSNSGSTARTLIIGASSKLIDGSANVSFTPYETRLSRALYETDDNLNSFADRGSAIGMCHLADNGSVDNPGGKTGWHHVFQATGKDTLDNNNNGTNEGCTQIANACGSTDIYVRSRSGGSITNGTAWNSPGVRLLTSNEMDHIVVRHSITETTVSSAPATVRTNLVGSYKGAFMYLVSVGGGYLYIGYSLGQNSSGYEHCAQIKLSGGDGSVTSRGCNGANAGTAGRTL